MVTRIFFPIRQGGLLVVIIIKKTPCFSKPHAFEHGWSLSESVQSVHIQLTMDCCGPQTQFVKTISNFLHNPKHSCMFCCQQLLYNVHSVRVCMIDGPPLVLPSSSFLLMLLLLTPHDLSPFRLPSHSTRQLVRVSQVSLNICLDS